MNLILFLFIATFFSLTLGEFGQFPFGNTSFSVSLLDIILTFALTALLIWNISVNKNLKVPRHFIFLVIFWVVGILSLLFSVDLSGWLYLVRFIIYSAVFYLVFHLLQSGILSLNEFLKLNKLTGLALALIGFGQLIVYPDLEPLSYLGYDPHKYRLFSTYLDPNLLGTFLNFSFILTVYELLTNKFENLKTFFNENKWNILTVGILGLAIILTFSRSAYLMAFISLFIILSFKNLKILAGFITIAVVLYFIFPAFNARISGAINPDKSAVERFSSWDKGIGIFQQNPILGVGFNNIRSYSQKLDLLKTFSSDGGNSGAGIDSSLIFVLATTGIIGFLSFVVFAVKVLIDLVSSATSNIKFLYGLQFEPIQLMHQVYKLPGLRRWYNEDSVKTRVRENFLSLPFMALTLGLIANSFFINSLFFPQIMFLWFALLGIFYGLGEGDGSAS